MDLPKRLRLWGIGGVGMSALAQHLHRRGHILTGYDREPSPLTELLFERGIPIDFQPNPSRLEQTEGIIYTPAIPRDFPEWEEVRRRGLPTWRRAEALSACVAPYSVIAVAGAHGKTTTSAILSWLLHAVGASPTAFVGGIMRNFSSTYVAGESDWAVVEADEYDRAFHLLQPIHAILQSVDPDHLEVYGSAEGVLEAYRVFLSQVKDLCVGPERLPDLGRRILRYELIDYSAEKGEITFSYRWAGGKRTAVWYQLGHHYAENASAALTLLEALGYGVAPLLEALTEFQGVHRRMETYPVSDKYWVVSDYAHHPTEIRATIQSIRSIFPDKQLVVFFQPHLYSRTAFFAKEFAEALSAADRVVLFPIYAAREPSTPHVTSKLISQHICVPVYEVVTLNLSMQEFSTILPSHPAVILVLGAGDIYQLVPFILEYLAK
ncbi:MAG: UDP-N-acetylmuramate--L-alanine ligase [Bacteroidia bacterium]|nr:UDP-N-acetylmuramate--L-alanine ligase [Bacteroidia bacterium]